MKIIYFIDHLRPDGAQFVLWQLVDGLSKRGHNQIVICLNDSWDDQLLEKLRKTGTQVRIIGKVMLACGIGLALIYYLLRKERPDAVVTMLFVSDVIGRTFSHIAVVKRIITSIQTRDEFYNRVQRKLVRFSMPWADVIQLCSSNLRDFVITEEGATSERIIIIPHSIRVSDYAISFENTNLRHTLGLSDSYSLIGSLGRLTHQKGYDVLIKAMHEIADSKVDLVLAGVGEEVSRLKTQSTELGLEKRIHFCGYHRDVPVFLNSLDLYVQPSRYEGMPLAVLQAMAAGCPIVANAVDGICELIEDGVHGWLVPPENPKLLSEAIIEALNNKEEAKKRGIAARERARTHFDLDDMITAWEKLLAGS